MSATDELRSMLDKLGIEHTDLYTALGRDQITQWPTKDLFRATATEHEEDGTLLITFYGSAEQAIEGTLGRWECRNKATRPQTFWCDQCDCAAEGWVDVGGTLINGFRYCPWCGRKVMV